MSGEEMELDIGRRMFEMLCLRDIEKGQAEIEQQKVEIQIQQEQLAQQVEALSPVIVHKHPYRVCHSPHPHLSL